MRNRPFDIGGIIKECLDLFRRNYLLVVPAVIAVFAVSFASLAFSRSYQHVRAIAFLGLVSMTVTLFAHGATLTMAREAVETGKASLKTAAFAARVLMAPMLVVSFLVSLAVGVGSMLFLLPGLAAAYFLMFALPVLVMEDKGALGAIAGSVRLVRSHWRESLVLFVSAVVGALVLGMVNMFLRLIPVAGQLLSVALTGAFMGVLSLVIMKSYGIISEGSEGSGGRERT